MSEEEFKELYKNVKKEQIIEELYYKCEANKELYIGYERLNNIINELEKFLKISSEKDDYDLTEYNIGVNNAYNYTLDYLKELKENK